jgi:tetratricopeptide (TPR) repeat protein
LQLAHEAGLRSSEAMGHVRIGFGLCGAGAFTRGLDLTRKGLALAEELGHRQWMTMGHGALAMLYLQLMQPALAREHAEQSVSMAHQIGSLHWIRSNSGMLASVYIEQGELEQAGVVLAAAPAFEGLPVSIGQRLLRFEAAELALARGDAAGALELAEMLVTCLRATAGVEHVPHLDKLRGEALAALGQWAAAEALLDTARAGAEVQGALPLLWRVYVALGTVRQSQGRLEAASEAFRAGQRIVMALAADVSDAALREAFLTAALARIPTP